MILRATSKPDTLIKPVTGLRPGHDRATRSTPRRSARSAGGGARARAGIQRTVAWYAANRAWWEPIKSGEYRDYYQKHYGQAAR
jgi:dTDP-glucose 4,6-dehydratase